RGERHQPGHGDGERAGEREQALALDAVLVAPDQLGVEQEGEADPRGRQLRQRDAEEDHAPHEEVDPDQRAHEAEEHAAEQRLARQEVGAQDVGERAHRRIATPGRTAARRSGASSSAVDPRVTTPSSTQITVPTSERTTRRWWLTRITVSPRSRLSPAMSSMIP